MADALKSGGHNIKVQPSLGVTMSASDEQAIREIVTSAHRLAVVGWSADASRPSNDVSAYLAEHGYDVIPVNPRYAGQRALGTEVRSSLSEIEGPIDAVVVFRKPENVGEHVEAAIEAQAPVFWMQLGIENEQAARRLQEAGITVVQDRCWKIEHDRFGKSA